MYLWDEGLNEINRNYLHYIPALPLLLYPMERKLKYNGPKRAENTLHKITELSFNYYNDNIILLPNNFTVISYNLIYFFIMSRTDYNQ